MKKYLAILIISMFAKNMYADLPADYQSRTAVEKQTYLWEEKIKTSQWNPLPEIGGGGWSSIFKSLRAMGTLRRSFSHVSDELPKGRPKFIHPSGSVVKTRFVPNPDSPYTGIYKGGIGLARLSLAGNPKYMGSYTPGMALKFFIDHHPSVNVHVMHSLDGQGDNQNFFENTFSNIIHEPSKLLLKALKFWFSRFVRDPLHLGIDHLAMRKMDGSEERAVNSPYQLFFAPIQTNLMLPSSKDDFRISLETLPAGTHLYSVEAASSEVRIHIGDLFTTSPFIASEYGDHQLFFQHEE